jgi:hypothetical protein
MGQSFGNQFTLVEVVTDSSVRDIPKRQLWVAAAKPDQAVTLVLCAIPEGWTATTTGERLTSEQAAVLNLKPGEVRELPTRVLRSFLVSGSEVCQPCKTIGTPHNVQQH